MWLYEVWLTRLVDYKQLNIVLHKYALDYGRSNSILKLEHVIVTR